MLIAVRNAVDTLNFNIPTSSTIIHDNAEEIEEHLDLLASRYQEGRVAQASLES